MFLSVIGIPSSNVAAASPVNSSPTEGTSRQSKLLEERLQHLEEVNRKLTVDLEHTHAADKVKGRQVDGLREELEKVRKEKDLVSSDLLKFVTCTSKHEKDI